MPEHQPALARTETAGLSRPAQQCLALAPEASRRWQTGCSRDAKNATGAFLTAAYSVADPEGNGLGKAASRRTLLRLSRNRPARASWKGVLPYRSLSRSCRLAQVARSCSTHRPKPLRLRDHTRSGCCRSRPASAVEQRPSRRTGPSTQADQAADVRPSQLRSAQATRPTQSLKTGSTEKQLPHRSISPNVRKNPNNFQSYTTEGQAETPSASR